MPLVKDRGETDGFVFQSSVGQFVLPLKWLKDHQEERSVHSVTARHSYDVIISVSQHMLFVGALLKPNRTKHNRQVAKTSIGQQYGVNVREGEPG